MKNLKLKFVFATFISFIALNAFSQSEEIDKLDMDELMNLISNKNSLEIKVDSSKVLTGKTINIGIIVPITKYPELSQGFINSAELAATEINNNGKLFGKDIAIIPADDAGDADISALKAAQLISKYKVNAIIGPIGSGRVINVSNKVTIPQKITVIAPDVYSDLITDLNDNDLVWRTSLADANQGKVAADFAINTLKKKDVGIIYAKNAYGKGLNESFKKYYTSMGGKIISDIGYSDLIDLNTYDLKPKLDSLFMNKPSLIYFITNSYEGGIITKKINSIGYFSKKYKPVLLSGSANNNDFLKSGNSEIYEGMYGTCLEYPNTKQFDELYKNRYKTIPENQAIAGAYDIVYLLAYSMLQAKNENSVEISKNLQSVSEIGEKVLINQYSKGKSLIESGKDIDYDGASGKIEFDGKGDVTDGLIKIWKIEKGQFVTLKIINLKK